jgi:hypothetical protein
VNYYGVCGSCEAYHIVMELCECSLVHYLDHHKEDTHLVDVLRMARDAAAGMMVKLSKQVLLRV